MATADDGQYECTKCGVGLSGEDAVELKRGPAVSKILCGSCLEEVGVPPGYELNRQFPGR